MNIEIFKGNEVVFNNDKWINRTQTAKIFNKDVRNFVRSERTKEYVEV